MDVKSVMPSTGVVKLTNGALNCGWMADARHPYQEAHVTS